MAINSGKKSQTSSVKSDSTLMFKQLSESSLNDREADYDLDDMTLTIDEFTTGLQRKVSKLEDEFDNLYRRVIPVINPHMDNLLYNNDEEKASLNRSLTEEEEQLSSVLLRLKLTTSRIVELVKRVQTLESNIQL